LKCFEAKALSKAEVIEVEKDLGSVETRKKKEGVLHTCVPLAK
jgi:hypothetical protein